MITKNKHSTWQPILEGAEAEAALAVVEEIAAALRQPPPAWIPRPQDRAEPYRSARGASLAHGAAGIALFFAYLAHIAGTDTTFASEADRFVNLACDALETGPMSGGLFRGLSGIAWTVQHLQGLIYDDEADDPQADANMDIDRILLDHWSRPEKFDLWEGCVGLGVYALERYPRSPSKLLLELLLDRLDQLSTATDQGISWFTPAETLRPQTRQTYPHGFYDLGVAHGTAGVISFLSRVHQLGIAGDITKKLLHRAADWLLAQKQESDPHLIFPQFLLPPGNRPILTPTFGWCHGDIGMAAALLSAARNCDQSSWETRAVKAGQAAIDYLEALPQPQAFDSTLCHGSAGLGHLFNRLYQASGIERFKREARKWLHQTLQNRKPGIGIAGYYRFGINEEGELTEQYDPGFIQGAAGIALTLLAAATPTPPHWDRLLLLSAPQADEEARQ